MADARIEEIAHTRRPDSGLGLGYGDPSRERVDARIKLHVSTGIPVLGLVGEVLDDSFGQCVFTYSSARVHPEEQRLRRHMGARGIGSIARRNRA